jgi:uncharacterized protein (TIGR02246 family)
MKHRPPNSGLALVMRALAATAVAAIMASSAGVVFGQAKGKVPAQAAPAAADARSEDRAAIRSSLESLVKSFESRDAKGLAAHWTAEGEYSRDDGVTLRGRAVIEKAFSDFFAKTPDVKAEIQPQSLRFVARDTALGEGLVTVRRGPAEAATRASYKSLLVREDGRWRLAQLSETTDDTVSIADLAWLIGEWKSLSGQGAEIQTTYAWSPSKKFINVQFTLKEKEIGLSGSQVIGVDPATGQIHTWTFDADGGVGEGEWSRDGDHWVIDAAGTLADGRSLTETNILRRVNDDTFTWQSINRLLDNNEVADLPPVKVTRVK